MITTVYNSRSVWLDNQPSPTEINMWRRDLKIPDDSVHQVHEHNVEQDYTMPPYELAFYWVDELT